MEFVALPDDILLHVLSFLHFKDVANCSLACRRFNYLSFNNSRLWKRHCHVWWNIQKCQEGMTWKDMFNNMYRDFGKYIAIYARIAEAWRQLEEFLAANCSVIWHSLQPGLSEDELNQFEQDRGVILPCDIRCIYRFHNGQNFQKQLPYGMFGTITFSRYYCSEILLPLEETTFLHRTEFQAPCLGLIGCLRSKIVVYICPDTSLPSHSPGTVFYAFGPEHHKPMVHIDQPCDVFIKGNSLLEWFTEFAKKMKYDPYPVTLNGEILRFEHAAESVAVTENICISAASAFMPMMSTIDPPEFDFAYRITLTMDSNVHPRYACQLETRQWFITDGNGKVETVKGPGVVGEYPVVKPGSNYSYISCTSFKTETGSMHGIYTMRNLQTGEAIDAVVPVFRMERPSCLVLPGDQHQHSSNRH